MNEDTGQFWLHCSIPTYCGSAFGDILLTANSIEHIKYK